MDRKTISIVIPALNEEKTIGRCVSKAIETLRQIDPTMSCEVIVADNGSTDRTREMAAHKGALIVDAPQKGYGNALMEGLKAAKGQYLIMADGDDTYNFEEIHPFLAKLKEGHDLVIGNRFKGRIQKNAMPVLHRFLGTPALTLLNNLFFRSGIGDVNCGMRAITQKAFTELDLCAEGMEFAAEMVAKAAVSKMRIAEVPCNIYPHQRGRRPHLNPWRDGWRHLRLMVQLAAAGRKRHLPGRGRTAVSPER